VGSLGRSLPVKELCNIWSVQVVSETQGASCSGKSEGTRDLLRQHRPELVMEGLLAACSHYFVSNYYIVSFFDFYFYRFYSAASRGAEYCDECVCPSVCLQAYIKNHTSILHQICCMPTCCLWPWLGSSLAAWQRFRTLCTSGFVDDFFL